MNSRALSPRAKRRRRLQQRQTVVFGLIVMGLLFIAFFAWLVFTDVVPSPWDREITQPERLETSDQFVCPPEGAYTVALSEITVTVYNSSDQGGLANAVATDLRGSGITVPAVGNWDDLLLSEGQIQTGNRGLVNAYTLAQIFPQMEVMIDGREDGSIDLILGHYYGPGSLVIPEEFAAGQAIAVPEACLPEEPPPADGGGGGDPVPDIEPDEDPGDEEGSEDENQDA